MVLVKKLCLSHLLVRKSLFSALRLQLYRQIFSVTGTWDPVLTKEMKKDIENYWRDKINVPDVNEEDRQKYYLLSMFPYPSGQLHMGHVRIYTISDAIARFHRLRGKKVIHPIGWDAFGLPAENAAVQKNIHPAVWTANNIDAMRKQLKMLNLSFDWDRELSSCDPSYYKWTQYLFLLMYEKGLAYKKQALVNWDPIDQTVLADEQVNEDGRSWRSGCKVEKRKLKQWFLRTTAYCKALYDGLKSPDLVDWRDVKKIQNFWIGECTGYTILLNVFHNNIELNDVLPVWTETPELICGATFIVVSPANHFNSEEWGGGLTIHEEQRLDVEAVHPVTGAMLPIFVSSSFELVPATDSLLGIPGSEDEAVLGFALRHDLDVIPVINNSTKVLINSEEFSGMKAQDAKEKVLTKIRENGTTFFQSSRKLKDWLISRQRYWGTPIPIINCPKCKVVPVPFSDLPVVLPHIEEFSQSGSSLKAASDWLNVKCPRCGGDATRETDTMDTFVDSSWYFMRYLDVNNHSEPFCTEKAKMFMPVDLYIGGIEHAFLHLFYARFMAHFCHSVGLLEKPEPFSQLLMQGMILGQSYQVQETGKYIPKEQVDFSGAEPVEKVTGAPLIVEWEKMSKSKFNGIEPETVVEEHGIDTTRLFILGSVAPQSPRKWNEDLFWGFISWQLRIWLTMSEFIAVKKGEGKEETVSDEEFRRYEKDLFDGKNHHLKGVIHNFLTTRQLSVAISRLQGHSNTLRRVPKCVVRNSAMYEESFAHLLITLFPIAPHFACELWSAFASVAVGGKSYDVSKPVFHQIFPKVDEDFNMSLNIKLNGEKLDAIPVPKSKLETLDEKSAINLAFTSEKLRAALENIKVKFIGFKRKPEYDCDVNIIFQPPPRKKKSEQNLEKQNKDCES